jgi:mono/diheme cytochrome c family protein
MKYQLNSPDGLDHRFDMEPCKCSAFRSPLVMRALVLGAALVFSPASRAGFDEATSSPSKTVEQGRALFAQVCAACHGARMRDPNGAFDLRRFPKAEKQRFVHSVMKGKGAMPPWGSVLSKDEVAALWAYVTVGEKD